MDGIHTKFEYDYQTFERLAFIAVESHSLVMLCDARMQHHATPHHHHKRSNGMMCFSPLSVYPILSAVLFASFYVAAFNWMQWIFSERWVNAMLHHFSVSTRDTYKELLSIRMARKQSVALLRKRIRWLKHWNMLYNILCRCAMYEHIFCRWINAPKNVDHSQNWTELEFGPIKNSDNDPFILNSFDKKMASKFSHNHSLAREREREGDMP